MKRELKSDTLSADISADESADYRPIRRPTVGGVNAFAVKPDNMYIKMKLLENEFGKALLLQTLQPLGSL